MHITVKDKIVKHNLELLKEILRRAKLKRPKAWIEVTTGEMRTAEPSQGKWKVVQICLENISKNEVCLEIHEDTQDAEKKFDIQGWTTQARRVVLETVHAINARIENLSQEKAEEFLDHFLSADIDLMAKHKQEGDDLVFAAWHDVDREGVERLLEGCAKGTYLFRRDPFASVLEQELQGRFGKDTDCITLTYIDEEGLVRDKTLVYKDEGIVIYNDDPNLPGPFYASVDDMIQSMHPALTFCLKTS